MGVRTVRRWRSTLRRDGSSWRDVRSCSNGFERAIVVVHVHLCREHGNADAGVEAGYDVANELMGLDAGIAQDMDGAERIGMPLHAQLGHAYQ